MDNTKEEVLKALKDEKEIIINRCYGGFGLSIKAVKRYAELKGIKVFAYKSNGEYKKEIFTRIDTNDEEDYTNNNLLLAFYVIEDFGKEIKNLPKEDNYYFSETEIKRDDEILVQVIKELGKEANGHFSELKIVKIPSGVDYEIDSYDGMETIREKHRTWY